MPDMDGKVALIIGSTTSIGFRVAETLARRGARVVLNGRGEETGRQAAERLRSQRLQAFFEQGDATRYEDMTRVAAAVEQRIGPIDILVSCGTPSIQGPAPFLDLKPEQLAPALQMRVLPRLYPTHAVAPLMRERKRGAVVFLASDAARHPTPGESMIGAANAAIVMLTKVLASEFSRWHLRVNCVAITLTSDTDRYGQIFGSSGFTNKLFSKALERFPFGRSPTASEVADVVAFLASEQAAQMTGQTVSVNGGLSFGGW